jgi:hypothetical protein
LIEPEKIDAGSKIRTVIKRRLERMISAITTNGWMQSTIRVIKDPLNPERFLCIDGMHRVSAMKQIKLVDKRFEDIKMESMVYPQMPEFTQCILADSN